MTKSKIIFDRLKAALCVLAVATFAFGSVATAGPPFSGSDTYIAATGGSANAQTGTLPNATLNDLVGLPIRVMPSITNTGALVFNLNATGNKNVTDSAGNSLTSGVWASGTIQTIVWNGTNFVDQVPGTVNFSVGAGTVTSAGIANTTNGCMLFTGSPITTSGTVQATFAPSNCLTKVLPTASDSLVIMDAAASNVAKTTSFTALPIAPAPRGTIANLKIVNASAGASNTQRTISASSVVVADGSGNSYTLSSVTVTYNTATHAAANGIDTASLSNSTWYYEYVIYNPATSTAAALASASSTSPTLPSGYTAYARIGSDYVDGSGNLMKVLQYGRHSQYTVIAATNTSQLPTLISGVQGSVGTPTYVAASVSVSVPATASRISVKLVRPDVTSTTATIAPNASYDGYGVASLGSINDVAVSMTTEFNLESTNIYYTSNNSSAAAYCLGWEDNF